MYADYGGIEMSKDCYCVVVRGREWIVSIFMIIY